MLHDENSRHESNTPVPCGWKPLLHVVHVRALGADRDMHLEKICLVMYYIPNGRFSRNACQKLFHVLAYRLVFPVPWIDESQLSIPAVILQK